VRESVRDAVSMDRCDAASDDGRLFMSRTTSGSIDGVIVVVTG
jgi:hypothetical protein